MSEIIFALDPVQGRRFAKLDEAPLEIAAEGIRRHLLACRRSDVLPEPNAFREIIDDAIKGRRVFAEVV